MIDSFLRISLYGFLFSTFLLAQENYNIDNDCPKLYTRSVTKIPKIEIAKIEVYDSIKYSSLPQFILSKDSISKLFKHTEIAKRAGVEGYVKVKVTVGANGEVSKTEVIRGIGAGCEERALDVLSNVNFYPAKINNDYVVSEVEIWVSFAWIKGIDKPDYYFDEILYTESGSGFYKVLKLDKFGKVTLIENSYNTVEDSIKKGEIPLGLYTKLNDFIISQCNYQNYISHFYYDKPSRYEPEITLITKIGSTEKYFRAKGFDFIPIGFWALTRLMLYVQDQIILEKVDE